MSQNHYSDAEKRRIADDYHAEKAISGVTIRKFAVRVNISKSTLRGWINMASGPPGIRKKRPVRYPKMEVEVHQLTLAQRALELELRNIDLQDKAREIVLRDHGVTDFKASDMWVLRFRRTFKLVYRAITHIGRKLTFTAADLELHQFFFLQIQEYIYNKTTPKSRIVNSDKTMVRLVSPGKKTISPKGLKTVSVKHPQGDKQGMTINLMIAADGTKFPAEIVFRTASKCGQLSDNFVSKLEAPSNVIIRSARKAWWSSKFEEDNVNRLFPANVNRGTSVLLRDHFSVHVMEESTELLLARNVQQIIIPPGMTGQWQPLDVSVNKPFKESFKSDDSEIEDGNGSDNSGESDEEMVD
ncbi:hypothetical protein RvY_11100 [Ramazzottius varieornatus]|uniref:HTH CENPB-type domain-containing protein n=1 Tax=Ramazzottius varieornatus TaxID=947166 RepID=A0A1D1VKG1_RAMVA|nr:hypothetical protein RvY_11100 [Ramazzottius varieornatus]